MDGYCINNNGKWKERRGEKRRGEHSRREGGEKNASYFMILIEDNGLSFSQFSIGSSLNETKFM